MRGSIVDYTWWKREVKDEIFDIICSSETGAALKLLEWYKTEQTPLAVAEELLNNHTRQRVLEALRHH